MTSSFTEHIFANARNKEADYTATKELARLQGLDVTTLRNSKAHNKTLLHFAAGFGRKSWVRGLIADGCPVDAQDDHGNTPLHAACYHDHKSVAVLLLEAGADVNKTDDKGWPALIHALARQENVTRVQPHFWRLLEILLIFGANPYLKCVKGRNSFERIRDDKQRLALRIIHLLAKLQSVSSKGCHGDSGHDSQAEQIAIIDKYLRVKDFFELVKLNDEEFFDCLNFCKPVDPTIEESTDMQHRSLIDQLKTPRLLKSRLETCDNITPLHRAAGYGHLEVANLLIKSGVDPNWTDKDGRIPLHNAAMYGHIEMIRSLVEGGSDVNTKDLSGYTPLHVAAECEMEGSFISCLLLIELGAKKDVRSYKDELPYDLAKKDEVRKVLALKQVQEVPSTSGQGIYIGFQEDPGAKQAKSVKVTDPLMLDSNSNERLFSSTQHKMKKVELAVSDSRYQLVKQRMLETIVNHANDLGGRFTSYEITSIELILHDRVWSSYRLACQNLENKYGAGAKNEKLLFHGSNYIDEIQSDGFDERYAQSKGMFGAGLYFAAHSSKSNQYAFGLGQGCEEHKDKSCYICERKMIYAQVALGNSKTCKEAIPDMSHAPPGFTSVTGLPGTTDGLVYPEYVIYIGDQAYPLYVITYRIEP